MDTISNNIDWVDIRYKLKYGIDLKFNKSQHNKLEVFIKHQASKIISLENQIICDRDTLNLLKRQIEIQ